jgi:hypothetical protein
MKMSKKALLIVVLVAALMVLIVPLAVEAAGPRGQGTPGAGFVDENGDGICDNCPHAGYGHHYGFVDADGDGVNDNFVDEDGDGICDHLEAGGLGMGRHRGMGMRGMMQYRGGMGWNQ